MYTLPSKEDSPSLSELSLTRSEYDEILNRILRVCDYHRPSWGGGVGGLLGPSSHSCNDRDLTKYGPLVTDLFLTELVRKLRPFQASTSEMATKKCYQGWIAAELQCKETNLLFLGDEFDTRTKLIIRKARKLITRVLGRLSLDDVIAEAAPGPGSSFSTTGNKTGLYYKYLDEENFTVTAEAEKFLPDLIWKDELWTRGLGRMLRTSHDEYQEWASQHVKTIPGNRLITVPKTAQTDRAICIEPGLNVMLQKGVGNVLRRKLRRFGIDLDRQHELHGQLVLSRSSQIGTIDLSAASDTISYELVKALLPCNWFLFLDDLRSKQTLLPGGHWYVNQKFSSMGNGFTFELESLIFWAIATVSVSLYQRRGISRFLSDGLTKPLTAESRLRVSVYGDDIICASEDFGCIVDSLQSLGFTVNTSKSFSGERAFKESCGVFSLNGVHVPIFNLKKLDTWLDVYVMLNSLLKCKTIAFQSGWMGLYWRIDGIWKDIRRLVPPKFRWYGPATQLMDGYIHLSNYMPAEKQRIRQHLRRKRHGGKTSTLFNGSFASSANVRIDCAERYYLFTSFFWSVKTDLKSESDYFGQAIYSLRNRRFQGGTRRGYTDLCRKLVILPCWEA